MSPLDPPSDHPPTVNDLSRRNFMKKSALTIGAVTILSRGIGFAGTDGYPGTSGALRPEPKTVTVTFSFEKIHQAGDSVGSASVLNFFNTAWPTNEHATGADAAEPAAVVSEPIITTQLVRENAVLVSSNSVATRVTEEHGNPRRYKQTITSVRTYVWGDPPANQ